MMVVRLSQLLNGLLLGLFKFFLLAVVGLLEELVSVVDINCHALCSLSEWIRGICLPWPGQILGELIFNHIKGVVVVTGFVGHHGRSMIPEMSSNTIRRSCSHHHILLLSWLQLLALELSHQCLHSVFDRRGALSHFLIRALRLLIVVVLLVEIGDVMTSYCSVTIFWGHACSVGTCGRLWYNSLVRLLLRFRSLKISLLLLRGRG